MYKLKAFDENNQIVYLKYDEENHILIDQFDKIVESHLKKKEIKKNKYQIRIALGHKCNQHCVYCHQEKFPDTANFKDTKFIDKIIELTNGDIYNVQFWGGEPLVYFDQIKIIYDKFEEILGKNNNVSYGMCSNGILLENKNIQNWLFDKFYSCSNDTSKMSISLSHDGPGQSVRGIDILKNINILKFIDTCCTKYKYLIPFNPVMTKYNTNLINYIDYIAKRVQYVPQINECRLIMVTNDESLEYCMTDDQLNDYCVSTYLGLINDQLNNWSAMNYLNKRWNNTLNKIDKNIIESNCFVFDKNIIVTDTEGNVIPCQSVSKISKYPNGDSLVLGNIFNIKNLNELNEMDFSYLIKKRNTICKNCFVQHICRGGCLFSDEKYNLINCKYYKNYFIPQIFYFIYKLTNCKVVKIEQI